MNDAIRAAIEGKSYTVKVTPKVDQSVINGESGTLFKMPSSSSNSTSTTTKVAAQSSNKTNVTTNVIKEEVDGLDKVKQANYFLSQIPPAVSTSITANISGEEDLKNHNNTLSNIPAAVNSKVTATVNNTSKVQEINQEILRVPSQKNSHITGIVTGTNNVLNLRGVINSTPSKTVNVTANVFGVNPANALLNTINSLRDKQITISTSYVYAGHTTIPIGGGLNGTSLSRPSLYSPAFASGTSGYGKTKKDQTALTGELGQEMVVNGNQWWIVGDKGAEFTHIPAGSVVFDAQKTKELLTQGWTNGRAKAMLHGTADLGGTAYASGTQSVDLMQRNIDNIVRTFERLNTAVENCTGSFKEQTALINQTIGAAQSEIGSLEYSRGVYMNKANSVGLEQNWVDAIQQGYPTVYDVSDDGLNQRIQDYQTWYDKVIAIDAKVAELREQIKKLNEQKLDSITRDFSNFINFHKGLEDFNDAVIANREETGNDYGEGNYINNLQQLSAQRTYTLRQVDELQKQYDNLYRTGSLIWGTDEWFKWQESISSAKTQVISLSTELVKAREALMEYRWSTFDDGIKKIDTLNDAFKNLNGLVDETMEFTTDTASLTDSGYTRIALLQEQMINNKKAVVDYKDAIKSLQAQYANGLYTQTQYQTKLTELQSSQMDYAKALKETKDSLLDVIKNGLEKEVDVMKKLTEARKDALSKQKEAYEWEKKVSDANKNINNIQAQIAASSGDTSLSAVAKRKTLLSQLQEAQNSLAEERKDHEYDLMSTAYDDELTAFQDAQTKQEELLSSSLEAQDAAIQSLLNGTQAKYQAVYDTLAKYSEEYGITLLDDVVSPWTSAVNACAAYQEAVKNAASTTADAFSKVSAAQVEEISTGPSTSNRINTDIRTLKYASGTQSAKKGIALTDEEGAGSELIVTKFGILRQMDYGDTVFNSEQKNNLWALSKMNIPSILSTLGNLSKYSEGGNKSASVTMSYGSLVTVNGDVSRDSLPDLETICQKAAEYTKKNTVDILRKIGLS